MKKFVCRICKKKYTAQYRPIHRTCGSIDCMAKAAIISVEREKKKRERALNAARREMRKSDKSYVKRQAVQAFNAYIRFRDRNDGCISCGIKYGQMHAGHYRPAGNHEALRFCLWNVNKQCAQCNNYKSGNLSAYRNRLIKKIGLEKVEFLENFNCAVKRDIEYYARIRDIFKRKLKLALSRV